MEYGHRLHYTLSRELRKHNIVPACRSSTKLNNLLNQRNIPSDNSSKLEKTGVYKIKCSDCNAFYIGQSGRKISTRIKEHYPSCKSNIEKSSFAQHLVNSNHNIDNIKNNTEVLHVCRRGMLLSTLEEYRIYESFVKEPTNILNDQLKYNSHVLFDSIMTSTRERGRQA